MYRQSFRGRGQADQSSDHGRSLGGQGSFLVCEPTKGTAAAERDLDAVGETLEAIDERFRNRPLLPHQD